MFTSCQKDSLINTADEINLNEEKIIDGLKRSVSYFKKEQNENLSAKISIDLEEKYKANLEYMNNETGLNISFNSDEFQSILKSLNEDFVENGYLLSYEEYEKNVNIIKESGNYGMFLEAQDILSLVSSNNISNSNSKEFSWGCGLALAGNFGATIGLSACMTGAGCPFAIAMKAIAMASLASSCL